MASFKVLVSALGLPVILTLLYKLLDRKKKHAPLPPGPKRLPLVGNIADLPPVGKKDWEHWMTFKDRFGPISSINVLGQTIVIINDVAAAFELLEKKSVKTSSRPRMVFAAEMCGWENAMASQNNTPRFRDYRKQFHQVLGTPKLVSQFNELQNMEVGRFLLRTMQAPQDLVNNIRVEAGAIILKISYGYTVEPHGEDPLVAIADAALMQFGQAAAPGAWIVDIMPFLRYLPDWLPGMSFKRTAAEWKATLTTLADVPFAFVTSQMAQDKDDPNFVSKILKTDPDPRMMDVTKWTAASLYSGGADTTVSSLSCFFLAMMLNPDVQRKAQAEIDVVIGDGRLPNFDDRKNLPYINAVVKEVLRWHPVAPIGIPHVASEDEMYHGYLIPKGATIIAVQYGFLHDPSTYKDPSCFKPERFLGESPEMDPNDVAFGFGRRACPGRVLADTSVWLTVAQSLAVFNVTKPMVNGVTVEPVAEFLPGIISHPEPYEIAVSPRSPAHKILIEKVETDYPWQQSDARYLESGL